MTTDQLTPTGALEATLLTDPNRVPDLPLRLIGRDMELIKVRGALDNNERLLLHGASGGGKTALAAVVASRWLTAGKGKVLWLRAGNSSTEALFEALARPFEAAKTLASASDMGRTGALRELLQRHEVKLVVLEDAANGAALYGALTALPHDMPVLITSSRHFPIEGAFLELPPLPPERALELLNYHRGVATGVVFKRPAPFVGDTDETQSQNEDARLLCARLSHLPLALEIAGKLLKIRKLTPAELVAYLDNIPTPTTNAEYARIAPLLDVVLDTLPDEARTMLLAFGAFFTPSATPELLRLYLDLTDPEPAPDAEADVPPEALERGRRNEVLAILSSLQDHCLIDAVPQTSESVAYYRLHDLVYAYVAAQTDEAARAQVVDACLTYTSRYNSPSSVNFAALRPELNNCMDAAEWASRTGQWMEVEEFAWNLYSGSGLLDDYYAQSIILLRRAVAAASQRDPRSQSAHLHHLGLVHSALGQYGQAIKHYEWALEIHRELGDEQGEANEWHNIGAAQEAQKNYAQAIEDYQKARSIFVHLGMAEAVTLVDQSLAAAQARLAGEEPAAPGVPAFVAMPEAGETVESLSAEINRALRENTSLTFEPLDAALSVLTHEPDASAPVVEDLAPAPQAEDRTVIPPDIFTTDEIQQALAPEGEPRAEAVVPAANAPDSDARPPDIFTTDESQQALPQNEGTIPAMTVSGVDTLPLEGFTKDEIRQAMARASKALSAEPANPAPAVEESEPTATAEFAAALPLETAEIPAAPPLRAVPTHPEVTTLQFLPPTEVADEELEALYIDIQSASPLPPFTLPNDKVIVGRSPKRHLNLNDPQVSRVHLQIQRQPDNTVSLLDLYSATGTRLDDQPLTPGIAVRWSIGQVVTVGKTRLILRAGAP